MSFNQIEFDYFAIGNGVVGFSEEPLQLRCGRFSPFYRTSNAPEFIQEMNIKDVLETPMALAMGHFTLTGEMFQIMSILLTHYQIIL